MKKLLLPLAMLVVFFSCKNQEVTFPDYGTTTGYFPYQFPVRTLVLGDYIYDNTNDNNHKFLVSATMGGVYENKQDRVFHIEIDNKLCENVNFAATGLPIRFLPPEYYTLSSDKQLVIPAGSVNGSIEVQLTDAFFNDTLAASLAYVLPVKIAEVTNLDSVLRGTSSQLQPDRRYASQWNIAPKDFTMFAVKYVNPYHGNYFHRGRSTVKDASGQTVESTSYHGKYIENDEIWTLSTRSKNQVAVSGVVRSELVNGPLELLLTFEGDNCTIRNNRNSPFTITGSGRFVNDDGSWGNKKRDVIYMNYELTDSTRTYSATDTLVIRDRGVVMEVYQPSPGQ